MTNYEYVLDNTESRSRAVGAAKAMFDASSIRNLGEVGVDAEWNCLELAACVFVPASLQRRHRMHRRILNRTLL